MTFLRMDILLSMVLLSTGHLHGVAAWPRSSRGMQPFDKRQSIELSRDSTCNDLKTYQDQEDLPGDRINKEMYEQLKAARVLDEYFFEDDDGVFTNYVVGFATPHGIGQSFHCGLSDTCERIDCNNMDDADQPGSGAAYAVLLSFSNFNLYLSALFEALNFAKDDWNGLQVKLQQTYWPFEPPPILLKELVNGLAAFTGMVGAASGVIGAQTAAVVGSSSALLGGIFGGINLALSTTDESLENLANLETNTQAWYQAFWDGLEWANDNLTQTGYYISEAVSVGLGEIIDNGEWVDYSDHPLLNDDASKPTVSMGDLKQALYRYLLGNMINFSWKEQGTFIIKYDMSEEDYNDWDGYWDLPNSTFHTYYGGAGFFLQRYKDSQDPLFSVPASDYPPGFGDVGTDLGGCDTACIMQSAADGWQDYGFNFNFSTNADVFSSDQATAQGWLGTITRARGFFNIPICDLTGHEHVGSIDDLNYVLEDAGEQWDTESKKAAYCYCKDITDAQGSTFEENFPQKLVELFDDSQNCNLGYW